MGEAEVYLVKAAECREQSEKSLYPSDKASWLLLAERWTKRAERCATPIPRASDFLARFFSEK
jgi:hypothetical protein